MLKLEEKLVEIQNHMYDSVTQNLMEFQVYMTMDQPLHRDKKMTSQLMLPLQRMPLMMML